MNDHAGSSSALAVPQPGLKPAISRNAWMLTFTDLVSLMLTFFVLLFSMSHLEIEKWRAVSDSLARSLDVAPRGSPAAEPGTYAIAMTSPRRALNLDYLSSILKKSIAGDALGKRVRIRRDAERLLIGLPADLAFAVGEAELSDSARQVIGALASVLRSINNRVATEGHADPSPMRGTRFASNWQLSLMRAESVAAALGATDVDRDIIARGFGDSRYAELSADGIEDGLARRVDIVILRPAGDT